MQCLVYGFTSYAVILEESVLSITRRTTKNLEWRMRIHYLLPRDLFASLRMTTDAAARIKRYGFAGLMMVSCVAKSIVRQMTS